MVVMQTPRQQYRESNLIKLHPGPVGGPVDPTVLRKTAVRPLNPCQPDQRAQRRSSLACGEKRACTLYEVAGPDQMITTKIQIAFSFAPRNAHRGDDCALENLVLMRQQNASTQPIYPAVIGCVAAEIELGIDQRALPLTNIAFALFLEALGQ